jgi:hypothetical protein
MAIRPTREAALWNPDPIAVGHATTLNVPPPIRISRTNESTSEGPLPLRSLNGWLPIYRTKVHHIYFRLAGDVA